MNRGGEAVMKNIRRMKITGLIIKACPVLLIEVLMGLCVNLCITKGNSYISKLVDAMALGNFEISRHIVEIFILLVLVGFAASYIYSDSVQEHLQIRCVLVTEMLLRKNCIK